MSKHERGCGFDVMWDQGLTGIELISSRSSGHANATTCTIVLAGKFDPKTSRRVR